MIYAIIAVVLLVVGLYLLQRRATRFAKEGIYVTPLDISDSDLEGFDPLDQFFRAFAAGYRQGVSTSSWTDQEIWPEFIKWENDTLQTS